MSFPLLQAVLQPHHAETGPKHGVLQRLVGIVLVPPDAIIAVSGNSYNILFGVLVARTIEGIGKAFNTPRFISSVNCSEV